MNLQLFSADERAWIKQHPIVTISGDPDWRPLEYVENGVYKGLAAEYLRAISKITGLAFAFVPVDGPAAALEAMRQEKIDLMPRVSETYAEDGFRSKVIFSAPYFIGTTIIVSAANAPIIFDPRKLNGKTVSIKAGGAYEQEIRQRYPLIKLLPQRNSDTALKAVADGRAYAAIGVDVATQPFLKRKYLNTLQISGTIGHMPATISMAVRHDLPILASIIDKSLASLTALQTNVMLDEWLEESDYGAPSWGTLTQYYAGELTVLVLAMALVIWFALRAKAAQRSAIRTERSKSDFLSVMSHEIRTPMNAILSSVELLQRSRLAPHQQELITVAGSAADALMGLLDDVLDLSKLEAHRLELEQIPTDIVALVQTTISMAAIKAAEKGLPLLLESHLPLNLDVAVDPTRLRQVLLNLLSNAVKFTEQGSVTVSLQLSKATQITASVLQVTVTDTGIGIATAQQARLFNAFTQADSATTRRYGGSGLGLTICRQLIELMQGTLVLKSEIGVGTTMCFTIPVTTTERQFVPFNITSPIIQSAVPAGPSVIPAVPTILVVDDHPINRLVIQRQLEALGCNIVLAEDGRAALAILAHRSFPLVLLDCYMPGKDGYQVAREIRLGEARSGAGCLQRMPIIAISAAVDQAHTQRCFDEGMDGVLKKPLRMEDLKKLIETWCDVDLSLTSDATPAAALD
ncbi:ATP-binding protein [Glaciimonas sp. PCH181]|uniref:ATP-binding protein n=1 Tax=Glaciimonas sp. PCH181 TaxID=2133943 RepID=UPI001374BF68|nr:ATP-binding protein [Glaciimonas sp. PCH181]